MKKSVAEILKAAVARLESGNLAAFLLGKKKIPSCDGKKFPSAYLVL